LRATCPSAAMMVKGIQSVATENMNEGTCRLKAATVPSAARAVN
jgi:hypothetical protein